MPDAHAPERRLRSRWGSLMILLQKNLKTWTARDTRRQKTRVIYIQKTCVIYIQNKRHVSYTYKTKDTCHIHAKQKTRVIYIQKQKTRVTYIQNKRHVSYTYKRKDTCHLHTKQKTRVIYIQERLNLFEIIS